MIDVVYFTIEPSFYDHQELRYSLRSLSRHISGVGRVVILGHRPAWLRNVLHLPETDPYTHNKDANIIRKMRRACREPELSDPFLFVNDDHYFTQDGDAAAWPYYHKGEIRPGRGDYGRRLLNTRRLLLDRGLGTLNFDVHAPILIHKAKFLAAFASWDWVDESGPGVVMKSIYGNTWPEIVAQAVQLPDLKFTYRVGGTVSGWAEILANRPCWSTGERLSPLAEQLLKTLYPTPSPYEREDL